MFFFLNLNMSIHVDLILILVSNFCEAASS